VEKAPEQRLVGAVVAGKYRIRRVIGAGSMGIVCEAEHLEIGKRLAIKVIDASLAGMSEIARRFHQEARAASLVESEHIVQVYDVGTDDELGLYLVMELLTGEDLAARMARERPLPADAAVRIALQVARALAKAHEAGVVHRDLKPANIFLSEREEDEPRVKILDFGISKVIDASRAESGLALTRAGTVVGTPLYMSPEQARGEAVDEKTDVWALGLVLYEMLAGRPAYPELPTYEAFIIHLALHPPYPLRHVAPWILAPLADVVHQAIERRPDKRPSCIDLARMLVDHQPQPDSGPSPLEAVDAGDTWTEPASRLPDMSHRSAPEDSLTIDIDVLAASEPASPEATSFPQASPLTRSGVRASVEELADDDDDALEFFDRSALGDVRLSSPASRPGAAREGEDRRRPAALAASGLLPDAPGGSSRVTPLRMQTRDRLGRSGARRFPLRWMALVFVTLGLVAVFALAFR
jgi:serine/threonine protein kinase